MPRVPADGVTSLLTINEVIIYLRLLTYCAWLHIIEAKELVGYLSLFSDVHVS